MKKFLLSLAASFALFLPVAVRAQLYWDVNGSTNGAGATPTGNWSTTDLNWDSLADGTGTTVGWNNSSMAVFSAGIDATNAFNVTIVSGTTVTAAGLAVEEGTPTILGPGANTFLNLSSPSISVASGATLNLRTVISNSVGLTFNGPGQVNLRSNFNSIVGGINLNGGVVVLSDAAANGGSSTVNFGNVRVRDDVGGTAYILGNPVTFTGDAVFYPGSIGATTTRSITFTSSSINAPAGRIISISATNGVTQPGTFSLRFNATNDVTIASDIILENSAPVGAGAAHGSIDCIGTAQQTFSGTISGNGYVRLYTVGRGDAIFSGQNTFSGVLLVNAGGVGFGSSSVGSPGSPTSGPAGTGIVNLNSTATLDGSATPGGNEGKAVLFAVGGARTIGNLFNFLGTNVIFKGTNDLTLSGDIYLTPTQDMLLMVTNTGTTTFAGNFYNGAGTFTLTKAGAGTLVYSGNASYGHQTVISGGKLVVNGQLSGSTAVTVTNGATLSGTGTISGSVTVAGASVGVGSSAPGTLTVQNGLNLSASGTYRWQLGANSVNNPGTDFDQIVLSGGDLVLGPNSTISLSFVGSATTPANSNPFWQASHSWRVISLAGGSNSGNTTFGNVINGSFTAGFFTASNDAQGILLVYTPATVPVPPSISSQPQSATADYGTTVSFIAGVVGTAPIAYQWQKDGVNVSNGTAAWGTVISGANSTNLTFTGVTYHEIGSYKLLASNAQGSAETVPATLVVNDPFIATQPVNLTNGAGTTATFSVVANGSSPLSYQWYRNDVAITNGGNVSGATTATLTITNMARANAGDYYVVVSGGSGNQTNSAIAKLIWAATDNLLGYWPLNEGTNQIIRDASGRGLDGYLGANSAVDAADPLWSTNAFGQSGLNGDYALYFNGTTGLSARVNDHPLLDQTNMITMVVDFKPDVYRQGVLLSKHSGSTSGSYMLSVPTGTSYRLTIINSASTRENLDWPVPATLDTNYHQLVGTYDGAKMRLYYDGVLRAQTNFSGAIKVVSTPLFIGNFNGTGWTYQGYIDNAALFDTALSDGGVNVDQEAAPGSAIYQLFHQGVASFLTPTPVLQITGVSISGGNILLNISKQNAATYSVQRATTVEGSWTTIATNQTATQFSAPISGQTGFYRLTTP